MESAALREGVWRAYSAVGEHPEAAGLGYPLEVLDELPAASVEAFAGVAPVSLFAELPRGARVLDLGCGAGLDTLIAAERVGPRGRVIGVDFSAAMLSRAQRSVAALGWGHVRLCQAAAEALPLAEASLDVALVNGIFNLNPARAQIFEALGRVVRPGGTVYAAELILREPPDEPVPETLDDWFS
jgi:ubiquinone/menaquinone biosynthesis C-methylase UbiE